MMFQIIKCRINSRTWEKWVLVLSLIAGQTTKFPRSSDSSSKETESKTWSLLRPSTSSNTFGVYGKENKQRIHSFFLSFTQQTLLGACSRGLCVHQANPFCFPPDTHISWASLKVGVSMELSSGQ